MTTAVSDLDLIWANWFNTGSLLVGSAAALSSALLVVTIAHRIFDKNRHPLAHNLSLSVALLCGVTAGVVVSHQLIGLVVSRSFTSFATSFVTASAGAIAGLSLDAYLQN